MWKNQLPRITTIVAALLCCVSARADDGREPQIDAPPAREAADVKRDLARTATCLAAADAIAGMNRAMRLNLDRRLNGRASASRMQASVDGR